MENYTEKATILFRKGYNCCQAVLLAFENILPLGREELLMISGPFGGGMGRMREVCGAVSGMFMVEGLLRGYTNPNDRDSKMNLYKNIQELAKEFKKENGSIICRELLPDENETNDHKPSERNEDYYKKRPCAELVGIAAEIISRTMEAAGEEPE